eukprot:CAMPEP_0172715144 /NCGR_PEP_ID=MMETSP1074-20121228/67376_1 /TAXON_ID=2916 /ORGANISM="Ceratium fusus, Strain PA161109" /LENGTH=266 /DNA_ID=CAMNT_0013539689 /DNA_START=107 /DNA_END=908 /DNA_ORIENTATION=-
MKFGKRRRLVPCPVASVLLSASMCQAAFAFGLVVVAGAEAGCDASNGTVPQAANSLLVFQEHDAALNRAEATGRLDSTLPRQLHDVIPQGNTRIGRQMHSSVSDMFCALWSRQRLALQSIDIPDNVKQLAGHTFGQALLFSIFVTGLALCVWFYFILGPGREAYKEEEPVPAPLAYRARASPQYLARPLPGGQTHLAASRVLPPVPMAGYGGAGYGGQPPQVDNFPSPARPMTPPPAQQLLKKGRENPQANMVRAVPGRAVPEAVL